MQSGAAQKDEAQPENLAASYRYDVPQPYEIPDPIASQTIKIAADGSLSVEGTAISRADIEANFAALSEQSDRTVWIVVEKDTVFADAVDTLLAARRWGKAELPRLADFQKFEKHELSQGASEGSHSFEGEFSELEMPVSVRADASGVSCFVLFDGSARSSDELYDMAFVRLDNIVHKTGGVEAVLANPDVIDNLLARIQGEPDTPWHCVAGAIYAVQAAGWPVIRLEVVKK